MSEWQLDATIVKAIETGILLRIPTLRGMAEYNFGGHISDARWSEIEKNWLFHHVAVEAGVVATSRTHAA